MDTKRYRGLLLSAWTEDREFFKVYYDFFKIMTLEQAAVFAYLCDRAKMLKAEDRNDGWFYCRVPDMEKRISITPKTQTRVIRELAELGFIDTVKKGLPPRRHIRLALEVVENAMQSANDAERASLDREEI
jgi:DNA-binding MarR family transcriptional regulator